MTRKPFRDEEGDLDWDALILVGAGGYLVATLATEWPLPWLAWIGVLSLVSGVLLGFHVRHSNLLGALVFVALMVHSLVLGKWSLSKLIALAVSAWMIWSFFKKWRLDEARRKAGDEGSGGPMISLVLLLKNPRYMEAAVLAQIVESAWGGDYTSGDDSKTTGFVVGQKPLFVIKCPFGLFLVNVFDAPYWDDADEVAGAFNDLRLGTAISEHTAWLSVDWMSSTSEEMTPEVVYPAIARLLYELANEDVLLIHRPETRQINLWTDDVAELLLRPNGAEIFNTSLMNPVYRIQSTDEEMQKAVEEARRRWPEFAEAFSRRRPDQVFLVKAPITVGENTEFIWIKVIGLEPEFIHGHLANQPVSLGDLKEGTQVEVPLSDLNDWAYEPEGGDELVGLFTQAVIMAAQSRNNDNPND